MDKRTDEMRWGLFSFLDCLVKVVLPGGFQTVQQGLGQAILEQAGAKGEQAKGPSTTQTPVPPQRATLGPCGLASGAGRQQAGTLAPHLSVVLSIFLFLI